MVITALTLLTTTAFAGGQKSALAHCGCNSNATDLEWKIINVSQSSKGHRQHKVNDIETCVTINDVTGEEMSFTYERAANDCTLVDEGLLLGVAECNPDPMEGESCSL